MYGKCYTQEERNKISEIMREKNFTGKNNHNWKGGITPLVLQIRHSYKYRQWRSDVFTRDDFICQECGRRGGHLHAHHIKSLSLIMELNDITTFEQAFECSELWDINNGITLCNKHHWELHSKTKRNKNSKLF